MLEHEVDGLRDRLDPRGLLVGHADAVGVLELLDQRVEIQRIRVEILLEVRGLLDARRIELQLVGQVCADQLEDFVSGHDSSGTVAAAADGWSASLRSSPASPRRRSAPASAS